MLSMLLFHVQHMYTSVPDSVITNRKLSCCWKLKYVVKNIYIWYRIYPINIGFMEINKIFSKEEEADTCRKPVFINPFLLKKYSQTLNKQPEFRIKIKIWIQVTGKKIQNILGKALSIKNYFWNTLTHKRNTRNLFNLREVFLHNIIAHSLFKWFLFSRHFKRDA